MTTNLHDAARELQAKSDDAYIRYVEQLRQDACLGEEAKIKSGMFKQANLDAHRRAAELIGKHKAFSEAAAALRACLAVQQATCENCHGAGEVFTHADDCDDDLCALNGDMHSCSGKVVKCDCAAAPLPSEQAFAKSVYEPLYGASTLVANGRNAMNYAIDDKWLCIRYNSFEHACAAHRALRELSEVACHPAAPSDAPAPKAVPVASDDPPACPRCDGSGSITVPSDNGPDAYDVDEVCPHCEGDGSLASAYAGVVKLLKIQQDETMKHHAKWWGIVNVPAKREEFLLEVGETNARWLDPIGYWKEFERKRKTVPKFWYADDGGSVKALFRTESEWREFCAEAQPLESGPLYASPVDSTALGGEAK